MGLYEDPNEQETSLGEFISMHCTPGRAPIIIFTLYQHRKNYKSRLELHHSYLSSYTNESTTERSVKVLFRRLIEICYGHGGRLLSDYCFLMDMTFCK